MMSAIRRYLLSGLLVWLPIWITLLVIEFIVSLMDGTLRLLPENWQPDNLIGFHIPGLGLIFTLLILFFTGMFVANFLGRRLVHIWESLIDRIPLVRTLYSSVKKVLESVFTSKGKAFKKVLLVEYPRRGMWSIAFQTGEGNQEVKDHVGVEMVTVFIPTTPNPTSGFLMVVPRQDVHEMKMTVDQALKFVISLGVVQPGKQKIKGEMEIANEN
jgi:uncharacterized membrane protein